MNNQRRLQGAIALACVLFCLGVAVLLGWDGTAHVRGRGSALVYAFTLPTKLLVTALGHVPSAIVLFAISILPPYLSIRRSQRGPKKSEERKTSSSHDGSSTTKHERSESTDGEEESAYDRFLSNVRMVGGAIMLAVFIRIVLFEAFEIDGPSMEPTLQNGDRVVVAKMLYGLFLPFSHDALLTWGEPHLGDVVIVHSPLDNVDIVKRVIGVAGDTIEIRERQIFRNGEPLPIEDLGPCHADEQMDRSDSECHIYEETLGDLSYRVSDSGHFFRAMRAVTVPEGHVFVRGDHRDRSNDSTNPQIGPVHISRIKGRALSIYLSCVDNEEGGIGFGRFRLECDEARWSRFFQSVR